MSPIMPILKIFDHPTRIKFLSTKIVRKIPISILQNDNTNYMSINIPQLHSMGETNQRSESICHALIGRKDLG